MKIGLIEVSHWHASMYIEYLIKLNQEIVALSDKNIEIAKEWSRRIDCKYYKDYNEMLEKEKLDFVFSFGKHIEMPKIIRKLIEKGIPFVTEKPAGIKYNDVLKLAKEADKKDLYAGVALAMRVSQWVQKVGELSNKVGKSKYLYFRYITGPPLRYIKWKCSWMLKREKAGGGCLINLGVHFIDLLHYLTNEEFNLVTAIISNENYKLEIEDYALLMLKSNTNTFGIIEVAYTPSNSVETYYSLIGEKGVVHVGKKEIKVSTENKTEVQKLRDDCYFKFIKLALEKFKKNENPIATLYDIAKALRIVNKAYDYFYKYKNK